MFFFYFFFIVTDIDYKMIQIKRIYQTKFLKSLIYLKTNSKWDFEFQKKHASSRIQFDFTLSNELNHLAAFQRNVNQLSDCSCVHCLL